MQDEKTKIVNDSIQYLKENPDVVIMEQAMPQ